MSEREFVRAAILRRVVAGELTLWEATLLLGVSYRQAKRLVARYRTAGRRGLVHGNAGRRSNRAIPLAHRDQVLAVVAAHYGGAAARGPGQRFGPTLAAEHRWSDHGVLIPVSTLTRWMRTAGLWGRARRARPVHQPRPRRTRARAAVDGGGPPARAPRDHGGAAVARAGSNEGDATSCRRSSVAHATCSVECARFGASRRT
jgi:transposase